jgi:hypothetical protein
LNSNPILGGEGPSPFRLADPGKILMAEFYQVFASGGAEGLISGQQLIQFLHEFFRAFEIQVN